MLQYEAELTNAQAAGNRGVICWSCLDMALVRLIQKDYAAVHALCARSLALKTDSVRSHDSVAAALQLLAAVAAENHQPERAVQLFGAASVLLEASNTIVFPWDRVVRERWQPVVAACLGDRAHAAYEAGPRHANA